jgi:hypothetical protein
MKEDKFYNPFTSTHEHQIKIERNDIEQALSWYHRLPALQTTTTDNRVYNDLCKVVAHMRSLDIE